MNIKFAAITALIAVSIFLTAGAIAQPLPGPYTPYPGPDTPPGPDFPSGPSFPGMDYPGGPQFPGTQPGPGPSSGQGGSDGGHPASGPQSYQPTSTPSASTTQALDFGQGETLSQQEVFASGGMESTGDGQMRAYAMISGLQQWVYYNGAWTTNSAGVYFYGSTSMLTYNDQGQTLWSWEKYPNGQQYWQNWGYRMPGYVHSRFIGDARGWHQLAMWGTQSGWSNVIWIYVW